MNARHEHQIAHLMRATSCAIDFACVKDGCRSACEARDVGMEHNLICLDEQGYQECGFGFSSGIGHLCRCPMRVYIAKELGK